MIRSQPDTFLINSSRLVKYRLTDQVLRKTWSSQFTFHANRIFPNSPGAQKNIDKFPISQQVIPVQPIPA